MDKELLFKIREDFRKWLTINAKNGSGVRLIFGKNKNITGRQVSVLHFYQGSALIATPLTYINKGGRI